MILLCHTYVLTTYLMIHLNNVDTKAGVGCDGANWVGINAQDVVDKFDVVDLRLCGQIK